MGEFMSVDINIIEEKLIDKIEAMRGVFVQGPDIATAEAFGQGYHKALDELEAFIDLGEYLEQERTYTQKELYQFVTEYSREAREEGFDMSVGDFVDWVASRDVQEEESQQEGTRGEYDMRDKIMEAVKSVRQLTKEEREEYHKKHSQQDKPVLPDKLEERGSGDVIDQLAHNQNMIIDYLKEKNL
jgi:hypothetical protein